MLQHGLIKLVADFARRAQRVARILKYHGDFLAVYAPHLITRHIGEVEPAIPYIAARHEPARAEESHRRAYER